MVRWVKLLDEAAQHEAEPPTDKTLRRYGLTSTDWLLILKRQGWKCAICGVRGRVLWNIDHAHVPGWHNMPDEERSVHVRGILCFRCNRYNVPSRNFTHDMAKNLQIYIRKYEKRRNFYASGK